MQRIERYGVIALLLLLVTVLAVSMWGEEVVDPNETSTHTLASATPTRAEKAKERKPSARTNNRKRETTQLPNNPPLSERAGSRNARALQARDRQGLNRRAQNPQVQNTPTPVVTPKNSRTRNQPRGNRPPSANSVKNTVTPAVAAGRQNQRNRTANNPIRPASNLIVTPKVKPAVTPKPTLASAAVVKKKVKTWTVKSGETLSEIAQEALGSASLWRKIAAANPSVDPNRLSVGTKLVLPTSAQIAAATKPVTKPASTPRSTPKATVATATKGSYTVQSGDVLSIIAQRELGSSKRWREIVDMNPGLDPNRLVVGAKIALPDGVTVDRIRSNSTQVAAVTPKKRAKRNRVR